MKLYLDPLDLQDKYQTNPGNNDSDSTIPTLSVTYWHFNEEAQQAIRAIGKATYRQWDHEIKQLVYCPDIVTVYYNPKGSLSGIQGCWYAQLRTSDDSSIKGVGRSADDAIADFLVTAKSWDLSDKKSTYDFIKQ